ncbi:hypothetical protein Tco_1376201 [Tanacetum coccineum]
MFDLELLTPSMNYIPVRKENYADSGGQETACNDVEDLDDQQFIVHGPSINAVQNKHSEEHTADKEVPLSSDEQALHDELVNLMHQESLAKIHNDAQRNAFEEEKRRIALEKGKECVDSTFTLIATNWKQSDSFWHIGIFHGLLSMSDGVKSASYMDITEKVYVKLPPGLKIFASKLGYRVGQGYFMAASSPQEHELSLVRNSSESMGVKSTFFLGLQSANAAGIFLSQDKYVKNILNKFDFRTIKPASTPIEAHKSLGKDEDGEDVDVHLYRSMIGCLMYLTASRLDIMFAVCVCARFQVTPKVSHLHAVKRIFRYLKHQPKLGLWYPKDSPFHLEAFSDSNYAGDNHDRRSTSGGCQYLGRRLVSWQCKKQTIVAISSTEAEYVQLQAVVPQVLLDAQNPTT